MFSSDIKVIGTNTVYVLSNKTVRILKIALVVI
jgi:hypothetical protein